MFSALSGKKSESGAILPILIMVLLAIGIVVGKELVNLPQIFKSRAYETGKVSYDDCEKARIDQANGRTTALDQTATCSDPNTNDATGACTYTGWRSYFQMKAEVNTFSDRCDIFKEYNRIHQADLNALKGAQPAAQTVGTGGASAATIQACNEAIRTRSIGEQKYCETGSEPGACTYAGWKTWEEMKSFMQNQGWPGDVNNRCAVLSAYMGQSAGGAPPVSGAAGTNGAPPGAAPSSGGGPSDASLKACNDAIQNKAVGRTAGCANGDSGACTYGGWKTFDDMRSYMREQGWTGNYGSNCDVFDAYLGQETFKGNCVTRVQDEYRKQGAAASMDPWAQHKYIALGNSVNLGALNDKGRGNFSLDTVDMFLTGPDGVSRNVRTDPMFRQAGSAPGVYTFTPTQAGNYKLIASGESSNKIRCDSHATFEVGAICQSACSHCIVQQLGGSLQVVLREGGANEWKDEVRATSCVNNDRMVQKWQDDIIRQPGFTPAECSYACSAPINNPPSIPINPTNVKLSCVSDTKIRVTWDKVPAAGYLVRLDNTTRGGWKACSEREGDFCRDKRSWEPNAESIEMDIQKGENYELWVSAHNIKGHSINPAHVKFSCPGGVTDNPSGPVSTVSPTATIQQTGGTPAKVGTPIQLSANVTIGQGKTLKSASVWVAKRVVSGTFGYPGRVSRTSINNSSVPADLRGFNCQNEKNSNFDDRCVWARIGYTTSANQFNATWTPTAAGEYDFIIAVEDSSFNPGDAGSYGLCASNPYVPGGIDAGYPYVDGYGRFSYCGAGSTIRLTVRRTCTVGEAPTTGCVSPN